MGLNPQMLTLLIAAINQKSDSSTAMELISEFWNTVQGMDSLTNLTSVADGLSYNLHPFDVALYRPEQPPEAPSSGASEDPSRDLRPEGSSGGGSPNLRPEGAASSVPTGRGETDPLLPAAGRSDASAEPGGQAGSPDPQAVRTTRARPAEEEHDLLTVDIRSGLLFDAHARFVLKAFVLGDKAHCTVELAELDGFDTKLGNQLSVEFDSVEYAYGRLLWMKGLLNPVGLGYAHFFGLLAISLVEAPRRLVMLPGARPTRLTLAGDYSAINARMNYGGGYVLEVSE